MGWLNPWWAGLALLHLRQVWELLLLMAAPVGAFAIKTNVPAWLVELVGTLLQAIQGQHAGNYLQKERMLPP